MKGHAKSVQKLLGKAQRALVTTHVMPDGDGLGSEVAWHRYLTGLGKKSTILNTHATPHKFRLVDPKGEIQVFSTKKGLPMVDVVFVLDTHDWKMLGPLEEEIRSLGVPVVFIDHHHSDGEAREDFAVPVIDESYSATGELVFDLLRELKAPIKVDLALPLYVSMVTDTLNFRLKHTSPRTHRIAADLLETGISSEEVYREIYGQDSLEKVRLLGRVLEQIQSSDRNRLAWLCITKELRKKFKATVEDTEAYINQLTALKDVEIAVLFREEEDGRIKVSLRGNRLPVFGIAKKFGGGGHQQAAGARLKCSLEEAMGLVLREARSVLREEGHARKKEI